MGGEVTAAAEATSIVDGFDIVGDRAAANPVVDIPLERRVRTTVRTRNSKRISRLTLLHRNMAQFHEQLTRAQLPALAPHCAWPRRRR